MQQKLDNLKRIIESTQDKVGLNIVEELIEESRERYVKSVGVLNAESGKTIGEERVRILFNPSNTSEIDVVKSNAASDINKLEAMKTDELGVKVHFEKIRLLSLAQTSIEESAMWAVKAITFK
jgi:hypothetical protein